MSVVAVVAYSGDRLGAAVGEELRRRGHEPIWLDPGTLAGRAGTIDDLCCRIDGRALGGILWRVKPGASFSAEFIEEDQSFADVETCAFWLAALNRESLVAPVRPAAASFFVGSDWPQWRVRLREAGVRVAHLKYGASPWQGYWLPYHACSPRAVPEPAFAAAIGAASARLPLAGRWLLAGREVMDIRTGRANDDPNVDAAADVLRRHCVSIAEIGVDDEGSVLTVDPFPFPDQPPIVARAAASIAELYDDNRNRR